ncbi:MAG: PadR family transcriptional regulator [Acidobacteria bacterium]|nr:MAG: PadR family transcriptional regulator [Acidobacteriota bacterium]
MSSDRMELPQGTLDLLILKAVALQPQHGWAISERLHQISSAALRIRQGSLYPALHRLERRGWIKARWGTSDNNRRAKYYELTRQGRAQLEAPGGGDAQRLDTQATRPVQTNGRRTGDRRRIAVSLRPPS